LAIRNIENKRKAKEIRALEKDTPTQTYSLCRQRVPVLCVFMVTPALYALRAPPATGTVASYFAYGGVAMASITGAVLEAIADGHKFVVKQKVWNPSVADDIFVGPTGGVYQFC
jgi:hypothetical protein